MPERLLDKQRIRSTLPLADARYIYCHSFKFLCLVFLPGGEYWIQWGRDSCLSFSWCWRGKHVDDRCMLGPVVFVLILVVVELCKCNAGSCIQNSHINKSPLAVAAPCPHLTLLVHPLYEVLRFFLWSDWAGASASNASLVEANNTFSHFCQANSTFSYFLQLKVLACLFLTENSKTHLARLSSAHLPVTYASHLQYALSPGLCLDISSVLTVNILPSCGSRAETTDETEELNHEEIDQNIDDHEKKIVEDWTSKEKTTKAEAEEVDSAHFASQNSGPWKYDCLLRADRRTNSTRDGLAPIAYKPIAMTSPNMWCRGACERWSWLKEWRSGRFLLSKLPVSRLIFPSRIEPLCWRFDFQWMSAFDTLQLTLFVVQGWIESSPNLTIPYSLSWSTSESTISILHPFTWKLFHLHGERTFSITAWTIMPKNLCGFQQCIYFRFF